MFNGKINYKWPFSIATLNYQRVFPFQLISTVIKLTQAVRQPLCRGWENVLAPSSLWLLDASQGRTSQEVGDRKKKPEVLPGGPGEVAV